MPDNPDRLNFVPPKPPSFAEPVPATTDIVSFTNNNPWPVHVSNNLLGITLTLSNRGDCIKNPAGEVVNDPRLMCFVGPGQLTVRRGTTQAPVVTYRPVVEQAAVASGFPQGFAGNRDAMPAAAAPAAQPNGPANSVRAFANRDDAVKAGLIDGRIVELQEGVPDTDTTPPQNAPEIRTPAYRTTVVDKQKLNEFASSQVDDPSQTPLVETLQKAATLDPDEDPVRQAIRMTVPSVVQPKSDLPAAGKLELPHAEPKLEAETDTTPKNTAPNAKQDKVRKSKAPLEFVDDTGKKHTFRYRTLLDRFVRLNYPPEKADEIMLRYPVTE